MEQDTFQMTSVNKVQQRRDARPVVIRSLSSKVLFLSPIIFLTFLSGIFCAAEYEDEEIFFSYERFYGKAAVMQEPPRDGKVQRDVSSFLNEFSTGVYAISAGDMEQAEKHLKRARGIWPEYFGTDFLLARINEDAGDYPLADRYYKSYLNKLRSFWLRENRISEQLIKAITPYRVENYETARDAVSRRLEERGIELGRVSPIYTMPPIVKTLALFFTAAGIYVLLASFVVPYIRKRKRIASAPEGYWVCPKCGTENTKLEKECGNCRTPQNTGKS
jgi:tetratricopeptide (TPR) repeat protein